MFQIDTFNLNKKTPIQYLIGEGDYSSGSDVSDSSSEDNTGDINSSGSATEYVTSEADSSSEEDSYSSSSSNNPQWPPKRPRPSDEE